ncbi:polysaccharide biosynthesis protein [Kitasatospora sp. NBC_00315]|uniref:polysaccharide biosynthesis protein n=1 Tax=Kitasatospora sp. NBC_00315 TaxID=2975963 RepID=UPI00324D6845
MPDDACVLVTGGTGSFGQAVVERLLAGDCAEIRVFSRDEAKQDFMRRRIRDARVRYIIGDVRDFSAVRRAGRGADVVLHAAGLKQVPACEDAPLEAVRTNVLGSSNVLDAAESNGVRSVVALSTGKAVHPASAMGMSKALMEKLTQAYARTAGAGSPTVSCVRYGNVMCSRGSVIPLFLEQILRGEQITLTEPRMTRFLMSLEDSVDLVLWAVRHARPGDVVIGKAAACTMGDLAGALLRLFDRPDSVRVVGARPGESLHEELVGAQEMARVEDLGDYFRLPLDAPVRADGAEPYDSSTTRQLSLAELEAVLAGLPEVKEALSTAGRSPAGS